MKNKTANIITAVYLFLVGVLTLGFLENSIPAHASGIAFLIAAVYGVVAIYKKSHYLV